MEVKGPEDQSAKTFGFWWYFYAPSVADTKTSKDSSNAADPKDCTVITAAAYKTLKTDPDAENNWTDYAIEGCVPAIYVGDCAADCKDGKAAGL